MSSEIIMSMDKVSQEMRTRGMSLLPGLFVVDGVTRIPPIINVIIQVVLVLAVVLLLLYTIQSFLLHKVALLLVSSFTFYLSLLSFQSFFYNPCRLYWFTCRLCRYIIFSLFQLSSYWSFLLLSSKCKVLLVTNDIRQVLFVVIVVYANSSFQPWLTGSVYIIN